jgi:hypothetical protein
VEKDRLIKESFQPAVKVSGDRVGVFTARLAQASCEALPEEPEVLTWS